MKKEELFETLSDLDPAMVKKARDYQRSQGAAWKKWTAAAISFWISFLTAS